MPACLPNFLWSCQLIWREFTLQSTNFGCSLDGWLKANVKIKQEWLFSLLFLQWSIILALKPKALHRPWWKFSSSKASICSTIKTWNCMVHNEYCSLFLYISDLTSATKYRLHCVYGTPHHTIINSRQMENIYIWPNMAPSYNLQDPKGPLRGSHCMPNTTWTAPRCPVSCKNSSRQVVLMLWLIGLYPLWKENYVYNHLIISVVYSPSSE